MLHADISEHPKIAVFVPFSKQTFGYHGFGWDPFSSRASQSQSVHGVDRGEHEQRRAPLWDGNMGWFGVSRA